MKSTLKFNCSNYLFIFFFIISINNNGEAQFGQRPFINITNPTASTVWVKGQTIDIEWDDNISSDVRILLYRGTTPITYISNGTPSDGSFSYTVPNSFVAANDYRIRIFNISGTNVFDYSDFFTISNPPNITVTNPNTGTVWEKGTTQAIQWADNIPSNVKILLFRGSNLEATLFNSTPSDGSAIYFVPFNLPSANNYRIRIVDVSNSNVFGISNFFTITLSPTITISNPTSNTVWTKGQNQTIQWTSNIAANANMRINLYEGGNLVSQIANFIPNTGSFTYSVPNTLNSSSVYRLQIYEIGNSASATYSDFFTIDDNNTKRLTNPKPSHLENIKKTDLIQSLTLNPNPQLSGATSTITIGVNQTSSAILLISDLSGKMIGKQALHLTEGNNQVNLKPILEKGVYFVSIQTPSATKSLKLLIE